MKKTFTIVIALALCTMLFAAVPFGVSAHADNSYTYNYDYWGEFTDSPDAYAVGAVITAADLGIETNFSKPQSVAVFDDIVYVCDTGNNRIVLLERVGETKFKVIKEVTYFESNR